MQCMEDDIQNYLPTVMFRYVIILVIFCRTDEDIKIYRNTFLNPSFLSAKVETFYANKDNLQEQNKTIVNRIYEKKNHFKFSFFVFNPEYLPDWFTPVSFNLLCRNDIYLSFLRQS